jgi:hypothetical protein
VDGAGRQAMLRAQRRQNPKQETGISREVSRFATGPPQRTNISSPDRRRGADARRSPRSIAPQHNLAIKARVANLRVGASCQYPLIHRASELRLSKKCALRRHEGLFAGASIICVVRFASPSESHNGSLQRNPHVTNLRLCRSDRTQRGLVMEQTDSALNGRAAGTDARLKLCSNLDPLAIDLAGARTSIAR